MGHTHSAAHGLTCLHATMQRGGGVNMGSQVNAHTCTDAYTHCNRGVGPDEVWLRHKYEATQG